MLVRVDVDCSRGRSGYTPVQTTVCVTQIVRPTSVLVETMDINRPLRRVRGQYDSFLEAIRSLILILVTRRRYTETVDRDAMLRSRWELFHGRGVGTALLNDVKCQLYGPHMEAEMSRARRLEE
ncbi:hypothetical protein BDZ89DRAFT_1050197, partial [Hymenopellis radicata]